MSQYIGQIDAQLPGKGVGPTLYKLDSTGRLRTWAMELDMENGRYRTFSGLADGKQAESGWTTVTPKSKPTVQEQARFEVLANYDHQLNREYHLTSATVSQPKMIEPMLAKTYDTWPGRGYFQPKLDGIRCIMTAEGMFSRQGQPITAVPHLHASCAPLFAEYPDLILDGELYNHDLRDDFGAISSVVRKKNPTPEQLAHAENVMQYWVYDTVDPNSPFQDRLKFYQHAIESLDVPWIVPVYTIHCGTQTVADDAYAQCLQDGFEGGIYRLDKPYEIGRRSKFLLKRKDFETEEFELLRLEEGKGNWAGAAKRAVLRNNQGAKEEFGAGIRGSYANGVKLLDLALSNKATATVRFFGRSPDDLVPRFGVVIDIQPEGRKD